MEDLHSARVLPVMIDSLRSFFLCPAVLYLFENKVCERTKVSQSLQEIWHGLHTTLPRKIIPDSLFSRSL